jgi:hypothetical protein
MKASTEETQKMLKDNNKRISSENRADPKPTTDQKDASAPKPQEADTQLLNQATQREASSDILAQMKNIIQSGLKTEMQSNDTKRASDIQTVQNRLNKLDKASEELRAEVQANNQKVSADIKAVKEDVRADVQAVKEDVQAVKDDMRSELAGVKKEIQNVNYDVYLMVEKVQANLRSKLDSELSEVKTLLKAIHDANRKQ